MKLWIIAALAWALALPGLAVAQQPQAGMAPLTRQSAPINRHPAVSVPAGPALVDVNSADEKTLDALPGVGPARAKAIVASRPYTEKKQLLDRKAVPANVYADIEKLVALVDVNTASAADMARILPNVGPVRAQQIVDHRPYAAPQDLVAKGALTAGIFAGIRSLVTAGP